MKNEPLDYVISRAIEDQELSSAIYGPETRLTDDEIEKPLEHLKAEMSKYPRRRS